MIPATEYSRLLENDSTYWFLYFKQPFDEKNNGVYRCLGHLKSLEGYHMFHVMKIGTSGLKRISMQEYYFYYATLEGFDMVFDGFLVSKSN